MKRTRGAFPQRGRRPMPRRIARVLPFALLVILVACGAEDGAGERALQRLERLAFLPPGRCVLPLFPGGGLDCSTERALLLDRYEVTRGEWEDFRVAEGIDSPPTPMPLRATERWPAAWMRLDEARRFAASQGMRLPTAREWLRAAAGTRVQRWPWSSQDAESVTNTLDLCLGRPIDAGSLPLGATPSGVHDLVGNVAEWVEGELGPLQEAPELAWTMGGSFLEHKRPLYQRGASSNLVVCGAQIDPDRRSIDIGTRLAADAEAYLAERLSGWTPSATQRERLVATGARWGAPARSLLEELAAREGAPPAIRALLEGSRR